MLIAAVALACGVTVATTSVPAMADGVPDAAAAFQSTVGAASVAPPDCSGSLSNELDSKMSSPSGPEISAVMRPDRIAAGSDAGIVLTMTQRGRGKRVVPHPLASTEALVLRVRLPSGEERIMRIPSTRAGVPPRKANATLHPGVAQTFGLSLAAFLPKVTAGSYCIDIEYEWAPGHVWRSSALSLTVD
jgi:hypothetical protein